MADSTKEIIHGIIQGFRDSILGKAYTLLLIKTSDSETTLWYISNPDKLIRVIMTKL